MISRGLALHALRRMCDGGRLPTTEDVLEAEALAELVDTDQARRYLTLIKFRNSILTGVSEG